MFFSHNEFHISKTVRDACSFSDGLFASSGNVILANISAVRAFQTKFNEYLEKNNLSQISAGTLNAMGLLDEIFHLACYTYATKMPMLSKIFFQNLKKTSEKKKSICF